LPAASRRHCSSCPCSPTRALTPWRRGDTAWFQTEIKSDLGKDPALYQSLVVARNRKWIAKIEAMLDDDKNYLIIVGTAHLVGPDSVIALLKKDGIRAAQR